MNPVSMPSHRQSSRGITLIELLISVVLMSILGFVAVTVFNAVLLGWSNQVERSGVDIQLDQAMEEMARDLREATTVVSTASYDEVRYSTDSSTHFIFYLYNSNDSYVPPPAFNQTVYELRRASLTGNINGTFTYGDGDLLVTDVLSPTTTDLSVSGNLVTLDLSVKREEETIRSKTQIRPRNL